MKIFGIVLVCAGLISAGYWITTDGRNLGYVVAFSAVVVLVGIAFTLHERITELTVKGVGTIKAAVNEAQTDAKAIKDLKTEIEQLKTDLEFTATFTAAQSDNRKAFDQLTQWAKEPNHPLCSQAKQALLGLDIEVPKPHFNPYQTVAELFAEVTSVSQLAKRFKILPFSLKILALQHISLNLNSPLVDRVDFLVHTIEHEDSINIAICAAENLSRLTKFHLDELDAERVMQWWKQHRHEFAEQGTPHDDAK